jgi:hypothetical protein
MKSKRSITTGRSQDGANVVSAGGDLKSLRTRIYCVFLAVERLTTISYVT